MVYHLELVIILHALKMWRHYFLGIIFDLRMDNMILKYLFEQPNLNERKERWKTSKATTKVLLRTSSER